jgi:hypothetical protein
LEARDTMRLVRRLIRAATTSAACLSLLLAVALSALWVRSWWIDDTVRYVRMDRWRWEEWRLQSGRGFISVSTESNPIGAEADPVILGLHSDQGLHWTSGPAHPGDDGDVYSRTQSLVGFWPGRITRWGKYGFGYFTAAGGPFPESPMMVAPRIGAITAPFWGLVAATAVLPLAKFAGLLRRRRRRIPGTCRKCGYDLRATPNRCPECGTATIPHGTV